MKHHFNVLAFVLCMALVGCGTGGNTGSGGNNNGGSNPTSNATMQTGQWEFILTPSAGNPIYLEANLTASSGSVNSTVLNTMIFTNGGAVGGLFGTSENIETNATETNGVLTGTAEQPGGTPAFNFSGAVIATTGLSVSSGTYTIPSNANIGGLLPINSSGTFTGYLIPPFSGMFTGTISNVSFSDQVNITVTQNGTFGVTVSGTSTEPGLVTTVTVTPSGTATDNLGGYSNVIGATIIAYGQETNVSVGTKGLFVIGHSNPTGTQVLVSVTGAAGIETGTLTKQ